MREQVVLAFTKDATADKIKTMLYGSGYEVIAVCHSKAELMRYIVNLDTALIIMGYKLHDAVADEVYEDLSHGHKLMAIVKADMADMVENSDIFTLPLPINRQRLLSAIDVFLGAIQKRTKGRTPDEEIIINKAKLFLMELYCMSEEQAHRFIQKRSMDTGTKFADTARMILGI
ncbi:MAG: ANTAR domain-containing protein [Clostridia bacterium]|nr:ANTAR domain-containing protein [Clostridia bacterium]